MPTTTRCADCDIRVVNAQRCRPCYKLHVRGANNPAWVGDEGKPGTGRARARRKFKLGSCAWPGCDEPAHDRHHKDGNTLNNDPSNVAGLCQRHHMEGDGRLRITHTPEARAKMSAVNKGRPLSLEHRAKISAALVGRKKGD